MAVIFGEITDFSEIEGANPFRIHAYRNAARVVGELSQEISRLFWIVCIPSSRYYRTFENPGIWSKTSQYTVSRS
ncbi:MAG: helix-hairpin-helix domain-containing protein [Pseudomonadota bacterium]